MSTVFVAILAGVAWMGLLGATGWGVFLVGALLGVVLWRLEGGRARRRFAPLRALRFLLLGVRLLLVFLWELLLANVEQLRIVLAPRLEVRPGWILFRSDLETPAARAMLGAMISLTPGSLTYEEAQAEDGGWIVSLHVIDLRDEQLILEQIRARFESPLLAMEQL